MTLINERVWNRDLLVGIGVDCTHTTVFQRLYNVRDIEMKTSCAGISLALPIYCDSTKHVRLRE